MKKLFLLLIVLSVFEGLSAVYSQGQIVAYRKSHDTLFKAIITISRQYDGAIEICQVQRPILVNVPKYMSPNAAALLLATAKQQIDTQVLYQKKRFPLGMFFQKEEVRTTTYSLLLEEGLPRVHSQSLNYTKNAYVPKLLFFVSTFLLMLVFLGVRRSLKRKYSYVPA